jgi:hypothetical protein
VTKTPRKDNNEYKVLLKTLKAHGPIGPDGVSAPLRDVRARLFQLCFSHGYFHIRSGDPRVAQEAFSEALHHAPFSPKVWAYWVYSLIKGRFSLHSKRS